MRVLGCFRAAMNACVRELMRSDRAKLERERDNLHLKAKAQAVGANSQVTEI